MALFHKSFTAFDVLLEAYRFAQHLTLQTGQRARVAAGAGAWGVSLMVILILLNMGYFSCLLNLS